jgi:hypothetical protein
MLEDRPILVDRLKALGVFSGIAVAAVAGFELVISGSLDFITPGQEIREVAPSSYVQVVDSLWSADARVVALASTEPYFVDNYHDARADRDLAGGWEDRDAPDGGYPEAPSEDELYADIQALYAEMDAYRADRAEYQPVSYSEEVEDFGAEPYPARSDAQIVEDKKAEADASASGTASPW